MMRKASQFPSNEPELTWRTSRAIPFKRASRAELFFFGSSRKETSHFSSASRAEPKAKARLVGLVANLNEDDVQDDTGKSGVLSPSSESQGSAVSKTPSLSQCHQTDLTRFFSNQSGRRLGGLRISLTVSSQFSHVQFDLKT